MAEFDLIEKLLQGAARTRADVVLGPGDDAAVLAVPQGQELVAAVDTMVEGVHFLPGTGGADLGWKILAVNLSDLAAMGATPTWALLTLTLPAADGKFVAELAEGFAALAGRYRLALVGGDTTRGALQLGVTALGLLPRGKRLTRAGARVGDDIFVTGSLGDAAGGLRCLDADDPDASRLLARATDSRERLLARLHRPDPRIEAGHLLRDVASACIDVSDGLLADLMHLCAASGTGARLELARLPRSAALADLFDEEQALELALAGGDDYELCFTASAESAEALQGDLARIGCGVTRIGRMVAGEGLTLIAGDGSERPIRRRGFEHFVP